MPTNVLAFNLGLDRFVDAQHDRVEKLTRAAALHALKDLVMSTRVDTGRARGNWQVGETDPPDGALERFDTAGNMGDTDTLSDGTTRILGFKGDQIIWIHNGVPYISVLEEMDGMLRGAVEALRTWLRSGGRLG